MTVAYRGLAPQGGVDTSGNIEGKRSYRLRHIFETTTAPNVIGTYAALFTALTSESIFIGAPCPLDAGAPCSNINPSVAGRRHPQGGSAYWEWSVDVTYESRTGKNDPNNSQKDPLLRPPQVSFEVEPRSKAAKKDVITDKAITNSSGEPYAREMQSGFVAVNIQKNFAVFPWQWTKEAPEGYVHSRNAGVWAPPGPYVDLFGSETVPAGKALIERLTANFVYENGDVHIQVSARILIDDDESHQDVLVDEGWMKLVSGKRVRILDDGTGNTPVKPVLLNGSGQPITGAPPLTPIYNRFQYYPTAAWSLLGLP